MYTYINFTEWIETELIYLQKEQTLTEKLLIIHLIGIEEHFSGKGNHMVLNILNNGLG